MLTLGVLFYNTISNYFSFDASFLKSFIPLMFKPGYLAKEFIKGKRLLYLHPAQMYLFISVVFFFLSSFTITEWEEDVDNFNKKIANAPIEVNGEKQSKVILDSIKKVDANIKSEIKNTNVTWDFDKVKIDSLVAAGAEEDVIYKEMGLSDDAGYVERGFFKGILSIVKGSGAGNMLRRAFDAVPITMFILLPLFALLLKLFYFKRGRYSYHLVFTFYFFSFLFTLFAILMALDRFAFEIPLEISIPIILSTFIYFYIAQLKFYKRHWLTTLLKSGVISITFSILVAMTSGFLLVYGLINSLRL